MDPEESVHGRPSLCPCLDQCLGRRLGGLYQCGREQDWDSGPGSLSGHASAWGIGLQPGSQFSWSWAGSASWAAQENHIVFRKQTDHNQDLQWEQLEKPATEDYQLANEDDHQEEAGSSTQMKNKKKKKGKNKGA